MTFIRRIDEELTRNHVQVDKRIVCEHNATTTCRRLNFPLALNPHRECNIWVYYTQWNAKWESNALYVNITPQPRVRRLNFPLALNPHRECNICAYYTQWNAKWEYLTRPWTWSPT
jgi:hypothetical protein